MKKINLEATFKRNRLGYWNSSKRLPNFVNVTALLLSYKCTLYCSDHKDKATKERPEQFSVAWLKTYIH